MQVKDVMVREVATCDVDDKLNRVAELLWEHDCGIVPVVDFHGRLLGVITDRDVCMAAYTKGLPLVAIRVGDVMSRDVRTCRAQDPVADVQSLMSARRVRRVPVVDRLGYLVGIVSLNDVARRAALDRGQPGGLRFEDVGATLAGVCQRWCDGTTTVPVVVPSTQRSPKRSASLAPHPVL